MNIIKIIAISVFVFWAVANAALTKQTIYQTSVHWMESNSTILIQSNRVFNGNLYKNKSIKTDSILKTLDVKSLLKKSKSSIFQLSSKSISIIPTGDGFDLNMNKSTTSTNYEIFEYLLLIEINSNGKISNGLLVLNDDERDMENKVFKFIEGNISYNSSDNSWFRSGNIQLVFRPYTPSRSTIKFNGIFICDEY